MAVKSLYLKIDITSPCQILCILIFSSFLRHKLKKWILIKIEEPLLDPFDKKRCTAALPASPAPTDPVS